MNMAQAAEQLNSTEPDGEAGSEKESPVCQTDFSVRTRLLPYSGTNMPSSAAPPNKAAPLSSHCPESCSTIPGSPWQNFQQSDQVIKNYQSMGWKHGAPNATVAPDQTGITYQLGYGLAGTSTYTSQAPDEGIPFAANDQPPAVESKKKSELNGHEDSDEETDGDSSGRSHSSNGDVDGIDEPRKPKRTRTAYSNHQLDQLELAFSRSHYPDVFTREDLSTKLSIKEDRIQVWFQNRRARYRKQERTGSISLRSKYRQKRLQKLQQNQAAAAAMGSGMYAGYYPPCASSPGGMLTSSPSGVSPYMPGFTFPSHYIPTSVGGVGSSSGTSPTSSVIVDGMSSIQANTASPSYLPGFNTLKGSIPFPASYVAMGLSPNMGSAYGSVPTSSVSLK